MPYYRAASLADLIKMHPNGLPEERAEQILRDILSGLRAAHDLRIVHRDIKPSNVLLDDDGRALISDFGLRRLEASGHVITSVIQSASLERANAGLAGTPGYLAPELLEGGKPTPAADVYSVGVLMFEMLTGRRPTLAELPSDAHPALGQAGRWDALYYWATRPVQQRFSDANQFRNALETGPQPLSWRARPPRALAEEYRKKRWAGLNRREPQV